MRIGSLKLKAVLNLRPVLSLGHLLNLRPVTGWVAVTLLTACGEARPEPEELTLETAPRCELASGACLSRDANLIDAGGVQVLHQRIAGLPTVGIQISFTKGESALQSVAEDFAFALLETDGPVTIAGDGFRDALSLIGARASARGDLDYSSFVATAPLPAVEDLWQLMTVAVLRPALLEPTLKALHDNAARVVRLQLENPQVAATTDSLRRALSMTRYAPSLSIDPEIDAQIDLPLLAQTWSALRTKQRLLVTMVGDLDSRYVQRLVSGTFGSLPDTQEFGLNTEPGSETESGEAELVLPYPDSPTWHVSSVFLGPTAGSPDYARLALGMQVLDSRLFERVRDRAGLAYSAGASLGFYRQTVGQIAFSTSSPTEAVAIAAQVLAELRTDGPSDDELAIAQSSLRISVLAQNTTPSGLTATLTDWQHTAGSFAGVDALLSQLDSISAAEVAQALDQYLRGAKTTAAGAGVPFSVEDLKGLYR
jgi:predicted Zn-dependent peptidase